MSLEALEVHRGALFEPVLEDAAASAGAAEAPAGEAGGRRRRFLIVSAPFGPFSRQLARELRSAGATVQRVLLNGGDLLDWGPGPDALGFSGPWRDWGAWLATTLRRERITDLLTYGDSSPHAASAIEAAAAMGLRAHVLEQGYFRPDWVTLDHGGVNANSSLPREPDWFRAHPAANDPEACGHVGRVTPTAIRHIVLHHLAIYLAAPLFPGYRAPYSDPAIRQARGHVVRFAAQRLARGRQKRSYERALAAEGPAFLAILQRPGDSQLWRHSDYDSLPCMLRPVIADFAAHAPAEAVLLVRPHPLDPGLLPLESIVDEAARGAGVAGRVAFADHGKLHEVLPNISGVVCVNSTAGLAAIEFGVPTITLGRAMYDMPGLTHQGGLQRFWTAPERPDADLYQAFRRVVMAQTQVNGAFATRRGRDMAAPAIAARLLRDERP